MKWNGWVLLLVPLCLWAQDEPVHEAGLETATASQQPTRLSQLTLDDLRTFTDVFAQIRQNYVEEIDDRTLLDAAINGMLLALDPHSAYLSTRDFAELEEFSSGQFTGIGVNLSIEEGRIQVQAVVTPSPANEAGLEPGDVITVINGRPVKNRPLLEAMDEMKGAPGTRVDITIFRDGRKYADLSLTRKIILAPTVSYRLLEQYFGYFRISHFNRETATTVSNALASIRREGTRLRGLILDLRDNPGGVLQPAVALADGFLDGGIIVTTQGRNSSMQLEFEASPGQWLPGVPIVVLVDRGSASASEVLAGALQDHRRAVIVGERTFGKGSVQSVLPLRNGSGLKLTTARYFTPSGRSIQARGIDPDVEINAVEIVANGDARTREADLEGHLGKTAGPASDSAGQRSAHDISPQDDYALFEALNLLKGYDILGGGHSPADNLHAELESDHE